MDDHLLSPSEIEATAKSNGIGLTDLCKRAQISTSTFTRWRAGKTEPTLDVYRRLIAAARPAPQPIPAEVTRVQAALEKLHGEPVIEQPPLPEVERKLAALHSQG